MTHDRVDRQEHFTLTQEYLAAMLGTQRPSVSLAAGALQREGVIEFNRGKVRILDRIGLEAKSCECYGIVRKQFERFLDKGF